MTAGLRASLVIDTNLFALLLAYQRLEAKPLERLRVLRDIRGRGDDLPREAFDALWKLFGQANRRIITQHVAVEVYGLTRRPGPLQHRDEWAWDGFIEVLAKFNVEEQSCSIPDLSKEHHDALIELGPTDAGLLRTAQREEATLLTDDGRLRAWAHGLAVEVLSLHKAGLS